MSDPYTRIYQQQQKRKHLKHNLRTIKKKMRELRQS